MPFNPNAHSRWVPYTTDAIAEVSYDPLSDTHIPFRASLNHFHQNWAHIHSSRPQLFLRPQSIEELQLIVTLAGRCQKRITVIGSGHSPNALTCTPGWMISLDDFQEVLKVNEDTREITVQSGIRLYQLHRVLDGLGLAMPNLGTISEQSISGVISTATHGSSLHHGLISDDVTSLTILLSNGDLIKCFRDGTTDPKIFDENDGISLFRAALVSLGALGIITSVTFQARKAFNLAWTQTVHPHIDVITHWNSQIFGAAEYERVWWYPYTGKALHWSAAPTTLSPTPPLPSWFGTTIGYHINQLMLLATVYIPSLTPLAEKAMFYMQYGYLIHSSSKGTITGVSTSVDAMSMNCLYRQYVNEWSIPLSSGPEFLHRLQSWLQGKRYDVHKIPFDNTASSTRVYAHSPIEVRPSYPAPGHRSEDLRPYLDTHQKGEPSLYINATLFRPYGRDIPGREKFYEVFEWLMKEYGGKPHWAKNWSTLGKREFKSMYGQDLEKWVEVRRKVDGNGVFLNDFVKLYIEDGSGDGELDEVEGMFGEKGEEKAVEKETKWKGKQAVRRLSDESDVTMTASSGSLRNSLLAGSYEHLRASETEMSFMEVEGPPPFADL
ncbi:D-arabinono-1,4-lactone oxidase [Arthrobotrys musiformis]|uniref:D-arabinono-1,4-lactone oxidase n=1 Tax=Arthrobotrys musiformis TaxID=47236 RepID=A0AAV9VYN2_9PEZI